MGCRLNPRQKRARFRLEDCCAVVGACKSLYGLYRVEQIYDDKLRFRGAVGPKHIPATVPLNAAESRQHVGGQESFIRVPILGFRPTSPVPSDHSVPLLLPKAWPEMKLHYWCTVISVPACVVKPLYIAMVGWSPLASEGGTT